MLLLVGSVGLLIVFHIIKVNRRQKGTNEKNFKDGITLAGYLVATANQSDFVLCENDNKITR